MALHVDVHLKRLSDPDQRWSVRREALAVLGKLDSAVLAPHVHDILKSVSDPDVGRKAFVVLDKLDSAVLAPHVDVILKILGDPIVGRKARALLDRFDSTALAPHVHVILKCLNDRELFVRREALAVLGKLDSAVLALHVRDILNSLSIEDAFVVLGKLDSAVLAPHVDVILSDHSFQEEAFVVLGKLDSAVLAKLDSAVLAPHVHDILKSVSYHHLREEAFVVLDKLDSAVLAPHVDVILKILGDPMMSLNYPIVGRKARALLDRFDSTALAPHVHVILKCLNDRELFVRREALAVLGKLGSAVLAPCVDVILKCLNDPTMCREALAVLARLDSKYLVTHLELLVDVLEASRRQCSCVILTLLEGIVSTVRREFDANVAARGTDIQSAAASHSIMEAALRAGGTDTHNNLAKLLGRVLAQHDSSEALAGLLKRIKTQGNIFSSKFSRVFSDSCKEYGPRGGKPYFKPSGWVRFSLHVDDFDDYKNWCVGYHGTTDQNLTSILLQGLRRPGEDGVQVLHGQAGSTTNRTIYTSPSIEYAAFPVYAQLFPLSEEHWGQLVLQCRVRPGSFVERRGTLGNKYWPQHVRFDPNFKSLNALEWLTEDPKNIVVCGLMMREFGSKADGTIYGELTRHVRQCGRGPEFHWTELRSKEFERKGMFID